MCELKLTTEHVGYGAACYDCGFRARLDKPKVSIKEFSAWCCAMDAARWMLHDGCAKGAME